MGNRLLHHRGVHDHHFNAAFQDYPGLVPRFDGLGRKPLDTLLADPIAPARQRRSIKRKAVLEKRPSEEMLAVGFSAQRATTASSDSRWECRM